MNNLRTSPPKFLQNLPLFFFMVHLLHRLWWRRRPWFELHDSGDVLIQACWRQPTTRLPPDLQKFLRLIDYIELRDSYDACVWCIKSWIWAGRRPPPWPSYACTLSIQSLNFTLQWDNARNNARCTQARKATHGLDGQHQDVDRTLRGRVNQYDGGQG